MPPGSSSSSTAIPPPPSRPLPTRATPRYRRSIACSRRSGQYSRLSSTSPSAATTSPSLSAIVRPFRPPSPIPTQSASSTPSHRSDSELLERSAAVSHVLTTAATVDPEANELLAEIRRQRHTGQSRIIAALARRDALDRSVTRSELEDIVYTLLSPDLYRVLTVEQAGAVTATRPGSLASSRPPSSRAQRRGGGRQRREPAKRRDPHTVPSRARADTPILGASLAVAAGSVVVTGRHRLIRDSEVGPGRIVLCMPYSDMNGIHMYYEERGEGPPLVLLHGGLLTIELSFGSVIPVLSEHPPGHRRRAAGSQPYGDMDRGDGLGVPRRDCGLLRPLGIEQADVSGQLRVAHDLRTACAPRGRMRAGR